MEQFARDVDVCLVSHRYVAGRRTKRVVLWASLRVKATKQTEQPTIYAFILNFVCL